MAGRGGSVSLLCCLSSVRCHLVSLFTVTFELHHTIVFEHIEHAVPNNMARRNNITSFNPQVWTFESDVIGPQPMGGDGDFGDG